MDILYDDEIQAMQSGRIAVTRQLPTIVPSETLSTNTKKLIQGQNSFSFNLFHSIAADSTQTNLFISPLSLSIALIMILNVSQNGKSTQMAMLKLLELKGMSLPKLNEAAYTAFTKIQETIDPQLNLALANSIWTRAAELTDLSRSQTLVDYYAAEVWQFDAQVEQTVTLINDWIADKTAAKIQNVVNVKLLREATIVLINAIYFKGLWASPFNPDATYSYLSTRFAPPRQLMMMSQSGNFDYYETHDFQAIRLPYANSHLSMDIFLPHPDLSMTQFQALFNLENWQTWQTSFQSKDGTIGLPRFKIAYQRNVLQDICNLSGLTELALQLADKTLADPITSVIHQTFLDVNEAGSEAAAATVVIATRSINLNRFEMIVDRPFMTVIHDRSSGLILFMGIIHDPKS
jgi:serine protease inhibitor